MLPGAEFPVVVCEAGWAETHKELMDDARLWLLHTGGQTRIVIVVSFTESSTKNPLEAVAEESEGEEQTLVDSIDGSTDLNDLTRKLIDLNRRAKLKQSLVGDLEATLYVYRASEDGKDIVESFKATVLPPPSVDEGGPKGFGVTMEELLGDSVPEGHDPADVMMFHLEGLEKFVTRSVPGTEKRRANRRAKELMVVAGVWEEKETYSQYKRRRRLGRSGV